MWALSNIASNVALSSPCEASIALNTYMRLKALSGNPALRPVQFLPFLEKPGCLVSSQHRPQQHQVRRRGSLGTSADAFWHIFAYIYIYIFFFNLFIYS